jgi:phage terminase small subunit
MSRLRNPRRERFAVEVASMTPVDRAYVLAGYRDTQWARPNGSRLAHMPEVAKRIEELRQEFSASAALSVEYLQRQLLPAAEANMLDFFEFEDGKPRLKKLADLKRENGAAIAAVKVADDGTIEVKLHNKNEAVNVLLRSIGAIVERHEHDVGPGLGDRLDAARLRLEGLSIDDHVMLVEAVKALAEPGNEALEAAPSGDDALLRSSNSDYPVQRGSR